MVPIDEEARFIKLIFELRAEGMHSDEEICSKVNSMGYLSRPFNKYHPVTRQIIGQGGKLQLSAKKLRRFVTTPVYCGFLYGKWTSYKLLKVPYDQALISIDLFNRANRGKVIIERQDDEYHILFNREKQNRNSGHNSFLLRHVVHCPECATPFLASKSRGKSGNYFGYYHCSRNHKYIGINQKEFESTVANYFKKITYKRKFFGLLKEIARDIWIQKNKSQKQVEDSINNHIHELKQRQKNLLNRIETCTSQTVQKKLEQEYEALDEAIIRAENECRNSNITQDDIESYFLFLKSTMEHPVQSLQNTSNKQELMKIWSLVFGKHPNFEEIKNGTPQLSLVFRLSRSSKASKGHLVKQLSSQWNTFEQDIERYLNIT